MIPTNKLLSINGAGGVELIKYRIFKNWSMDQFRPISKIQKYWNFLNFLRYFHGINANEISKKLAI